ncbi:acetate kinase [Salana multivorans]|uniref:Acetate kinase n=1 Tax=Salana multivorans TaxID=120377 RepID=A0A3N2DCC6_9MICO|nr:acetate kinase [Salana multivorans]MBN8881354.1 acetate kinase [Salana multivorans]OJX97814.1 MAG: acetate kinase [Micrococcales bacterium 73-15]ROR97413.1 acetate kinase [Salana multivorans]
MSTSRSVLVINSGSSSLKYQLLDADTGDSLATGLIDRIGEDYSNVAHTANGEKTTRQLPIPDHEVAIEVMLGLFDELGPSSLAEAGIVGVGHRVVHGGTQIVGPTLVDDAAEAIVAELAPLAPLHNPANLTGIRVARRLLPDVPHVIVADTAFFTNLPAASATYALDREVAEKHQVRRYGAHGTSHQYVSKAAAEFLGRDVADLNQIVLHLGNGASASAVRGGAPIDTSMGLTPLEGLVMGTRTGDIDPAVVVHLYRNAGLSIDEIDDVLNRRSGVKGLAGVTDMRELDELVKAGDPAAQLALDVYALRLKKYVGSYHAELGRLDVITFTAGIGENDDVVRARSLEGLEMWGIEVDPERNAVRSKEPRVISPDGARVTVLVVPTNEELEITHQVLEVI